MVVRARVPTPRLIPPLPLLQLAAVLRRITRICVGTSHLQKLSSRDEPRLAVGDADPVAAGVQGTRILPRVRLPLRAAAHMQRKVAHRHATAELQRCSCSLLRSAAAASLRASLPHYCLRCLPLLLLLLLPLPPPRTFAGSVPASGSPPRPPACIECDVFIISPNSDRQPFSSPPALLDAQGGYEEVEEEQKHPLTDMPDSQPNVKISYMFPDHLDQAFPAGELVSALIGIRNEGKYQVTVDGVMGSLNSPRDFGIYVHNFTGQMYDDIQLASGEETTILYRFMPDASLYALDFTVALTAFYKVGEIAAADTFFNQTVSIVQGGGGFDLQMLSIYLLLLAVLASPFYLGYRAAVKAGIVKEPKKAAPKKVERGTSKDAAGEWLKGMKTPDKKSN